MNNPHCSCRWCWPSQEPGSIRTTSRRPPRPATVRWRPRARNNCETKASGQTRRQNSWLSSTSTSRALGTTLPQNRWLPSWAWQAVIAPQPPIWKGQGSKPGISSVPIRPSQPTSSTQRVRWACRSDQALNSCKAGDREEQNQADPSRGAL